MPFFVSVALHCLFVVLIVQIGLVSRRQWVRTRVWSRSMKWVDWIEAGWLLFTVTGTAVVLLHWEPFRWACWQKGGSSIFVPPSSLGVPWREYAGLVICSVLALYMPSLVWKEEIRFRKGVRAYSGLLVSSLGFGLVHMLAGVPCAVAVAIALAGCVFGLRRLRAGLRSSARLHTAYNWIVLAIAALCYLGLLVCEWCGEKNPVGNESNESGPFVVNIWVLCGWVGVSWLFLSRRYFGRWIDMSGEWMVRAGLGLACASGLLGQMALGYGVLLASILLLGCRARLLTSGFAEVR